jgi:hypothetical protein
MKKILALVISACVLASTPAFAETKKPAPKKEVKHHKKAEGTEIAGTKPDTVVQKKKKK